jgi:hypothetical protein
MSQLFEAGRYRPPVFKYGSVPPFPPQTIISVPDQTAVWADRAASPAAVAVALQIFVAGL